MIKASLAEFMTSIRVLQTLKLREVMVFFFQALDFIAADIMV